MTHEGPRQHFVDQGQGEPLLFVHGNPTWSFYFRHLIEQFSPQYRTVAVDHIGCGLSDKPQTYDYCLQKHIDNLVQLIDHLNLNNTTLVAHDWGGAIGLGALLERRSAFKKIVLLNTGAFPPPYIPFRIRVCRWPILGKIAVQGLNAFARGAVTMATERPGGLDTDVADGMLHPYQNWADRIAIHQFVKDIPLAATHRTWNVLEAIESKLASLSDVPIKLIWGMKDWCFRPECMERFLSHWPHADVTRLEKAGHYVLEDAPDEVTRAIAHFLEPKNG